VLLAVGLTLLLANLLKIPQSTSQATVFALVAPAVYFDVLKTRKLFMEMIPAWFFLPVVSFFTLYVVGRFVYGPLKRRFRWDTAVISGHPALKWTVVLVACYVAFAIGSNNVANAAGPIASMGATEMRIDPGDERFVLLMLFSALVVAPCFGIGSSLLGARVMETTGKKIVEFGPLGAVLISILTASLLLVASVTRGIPTSLVQMNTAAILGLGVCKVGWRRVFAQTSVKKLLGVWIMAPVIAFSISMAFTFLADWAGLLQRG
jgi:phosphate/sulfate permease